MFHSRMITGQQGNHVTNVSTFAYVVKLARPGAFENMTPKEEAVVDEHFEYLKSGLAEKRVILAGPCLDGAFGIVIFRAHSAKDAEKFMKNDPAVKQGVMTGELHSFRVSIMEKEL